ncbi:hypothetical protein PPERSA_10883 [Pseudocohnilembus persalinus]|uniref:Uncharacterized protein n=1 Tax=Pseudocohnilembus persalinus TaxID=266149 RepID=A0A0V0R6W5_PSEPJ|nr:hypothetical protein PPERSA_10883 [Pseudocohnilembus persalinus]|eukprot:KRX10217.1 hypothetical protein PPERSA_10883 [Pseudocohnilembus persalinus]
MFQYGLVGNTIYYGGIIAVFGYLGFELYTIGNQTASIPEEFAKELLNPKHVKEIAQKGNKLQSDKKIDYEYIARQMALDKNYSNPLDKQLNEAKKLEEENKLLAQQQNKNQIKKQKETLIEPDI